MLRRERIVGNFFPKIQFSSTDNFFTRVGYLIKNTTHVLVYGIIFQRTDFFNESFVAMNNIIQTWLFMYTNVAW